jgi:uncharacterized protein (DUF1501 family)
MSGLSRRLFLKRGALAGAALGGTFLPGFARRALAQTDTSGKVFVFLFLRGALDGLSVVVPTGEPRLRELRPGLVPASLDLGVPGYGLHPSLEPLLPLVREGTLGFVHAVGSPEPTRSHFDAQDYLELGTPGVKNTAAGFLARAMPVHAPVEVVAVTQHLPRSLQGDRGALAFASLEQLRLRPLAGGPGGPEGRSLSRRAFEAMYQEAADDPVGASGKEAFAAVELLERKLGEVRLRGAGRGGQQAGADGGYPNGRLGQSMQLLAALIKSGVGLRVGFAEASGWDTHAAQPGVLARGLADLAKALAAFRADLGPRFDDVLLVAATEFGRTARQNGALGTDHGHGSVAFYLGGKANGGKVLGRFPGLADDQLFEGRDLAVTTDLRSVLGAALRAQLPGVDVASVFPGYTDPVLSNLARV